MKFVSVTRTVVGLRRTQFVVSNGSAFTAAVTFRCSVCRAALLLSSVPTHRRSSVWVDWCPCEPAPAWEVTIVSWRGDGWDALRDLIHDAEEGPESPSSDPEPPPTPS